MTDTTGAYSQFCDWLDRFCLAKTYTFVWQPTLGKVYKLKDQPDGLTGAIHFGCRKKHFRVIANGLKSNTPAEWVENRQTLSTAIDYLPMFEEKLILPVKLYLEKIPEYLEHFLVHPDVINFAFETWFIPNPAPKLIDLWEQKQKRESYKSDDPRAIPLEEIAL